MDDLYKYIIEDVKYIRDKVDTLDTKLDDFKSNTEHRLTKVERDSALYGSIGGAVLGFIASMFGRNA